MSRGGAGGSRALRVYAIAVAVLFAAFFARNAIRRPGSWTAHFVVGGVLALTSLALMWCAFRVWRTRWNVVVRAVVAGVLGYHALFGPAVLLWRSNPWLDRDESLLATLWPHVGRWINSFG